LGIGDGNHPDAMQGEVGVQVAGVASNNYGSITIDSNRIIRQTDPHLPFQFGLQGISAFDSDWSYLTVTNNIVITSSCWGIGFSSVHGGVIANNTVVNDGLLSTSGGCQPAINIGDKTHEGSSSNGVQAYNSIANAVTVYNLDSIVATYNVGMATVGAVFSWYVKGVVAYYGAPGIYGSGNLIAAGGSQR
jgi:hypothetical protein